LAIRIAVLTALVVTSACGGARTTPSPMPAQDPVATSPSAPPAEPNIAADTDASGRSHGIAADTAAVTAAELDRRTAELFGDVLRVDATIPVPSDTMELANTEAVTWDIDVRSYETMDRVRHYVAAFSGPARDRFVSRLSRGTRYEAMIREKLRNGDVPEDMYFLALVESGYNPHAYSTAAAVGMWQFMTATAKGMGLRVDWWVDERRDPVRSTLAAVRFLRGLREQFGSMYLAAAAYNGGPGRIARGLTRFADDLEGTTGDDVFFALAEKQYLRNETREYVPQLVASALVAKEPDRYLLRFDSLPPFAYDSVRVGPRVPLAAIAGGAGTTVAVIQDLNPHILRGMTPPKDSLKVRVPVGKAARFDSAFRALPAEARVGAKVVTASAGATWSSLARKEPRTVTAKTLALYNPTVKPSRKTGAIAKGTSVLIPTPAVVAAALPVPDPAIERYGTGNRTHVVKRGENLSVIAKRYRTTTAAIMRLNRLKKPLIFPGQELLVNGRAVAKPAAKPAAKTPAPTPKATTSKKTAQAKR
jgi:membrane-bound lytic murein transglycosylase D